MQLGLSLFLVALLVGITMPLFAVQRLGLSVHLLGILQGLFLVAIGLLWPRLNLGTVGSRVTFWALTYGCLAPWSANLLAATWGAGNTLLPLAAGQAHGSPMQEHVIEVLLRSGAVALIAAVVLLLRGLRSGVDTSR